MNDTTDIQSSVIEPKRRSRLADFFVRLVREKPLGTISGIIVLIFIFVAIFADDPWLLFHMMKYTYWTGCRARQPSICWVPTSWGETS